MQLCKTTPHPLEIYDDQDEGAIKSILFVLPRITHENGYLFRQCMEVFLVHGVPERCYLD